jgi:hypothetical protein
MKQQDPSPQSDLRRDAWVIQKLRETIDGFPDT